MTSAAGTAAIETARQWLDVHGQIGTQLADTIWRLAEPGLCEFRSADALCAALTQAGFDVQRGAAGMPTAFVARYGSGSPQIGLMAEYDATPGDSQLPEPHRAPIGPLVPGFTDLHNGIGAASVTAALAIADAMKRDGIAGSIVIFGTPAEKLCLAKPFMARDGYFDGLDAVVAWHPRPYTTAEWDTGPGCYQAEIHEFHGQGTYGAAPWAGVSALDALTLMNVIVQFQREHIPPWHVASVNELFTQGGQHPTSLPNFAQAWYVHRAKTLAGISYVHDMLERAGKASAAALGASHEGRVVAATRPWLPNHAMARAAHRALELAGPPQVPAEMLDFARTVLAELGRPVEEQPFDTVITPPDAGVTSEFAGGADDVTEFCWHAPTARIYVAYGLARERRLPNWARGAFAGTPAAHATVATAARAVAYMTLDLLTDEGLRSEVRREFDERLAEVGRIEPLLPADARPPVDPDEAPPYVREYLLAASRSTPSSA